MLTPRSRAKRELFPLYSSDTYDRIEEIERKLARSKKRSKSLERKLKNLIKRKEMLEEHIADGTTLKVIFGTKKLLVERAKGKITNRQWKDARNNQVYSIGQANQRGNANIRIKDDSIGINFPWRMNREKGREESTE